MVNQHIIEIILQAEDKVSQVTKKVEDQVKKIGGTGQNSFSQASQAGENFNQKMKNTSPTIEQMQNKLKNMASNGVSGLNQLSSAEIKFIQNSMTATSATQTAANAIQNLGTSGMQAFQQLSSAERQALVELSSMGTSANTTSNTIKSTFSNAFNTIKQKANDAANSFKEKFSNALSNIKSKVDSLSNSFSGMGGIISSALGTIGMSSIADLTIGLAMTRERVTNLTAATMGSRDAAEKYMNTMDQMTNSSLVSLNDLAQAMNTIKMSTGMTNEQLEKFTPVVNDIGQRAILMGKDGNEAMSLMQAAGRGLNGEFDMLKSNFGITKEQLMNLGWSGAADDVEGYQKALEKALEAGGSMDEMMNTTSGQIALVKKAFTTAGRQIGEVFLPAIKQILEFTLQIKNSHPEVFKYAIVIGALGSAFAVVAPILVSVASAIAKIGNAIMGIPEKFRQLKSTISDAKDALVKFKDKLVTSWNEGKLATLKDKFALLKDKILSAGEALKSYGRQAGIATIKVAALVLGVDADIVSKQLEAVATGEVTVAQALLNVVMAANPFVLVAMAIIALVAALTWLYFNCEPVRNALDTLGQMAMQLAQWIWSGLIAAWNALSSALQPVISVIQGTLIPIFTALFEMLTGGSTNSVDFFTEAWNTLSEALQPLVDFLESVFMPIWELVTEVIMIIIENVMLLISTFESFLNGQITLGEFLTQIWNIIQSMFFSVVTTIVTRILTWGAELLAYGINAGRNFLNGVVTFISQLPGRVYTFILSTLSRIISGGAQWVSNARSKASQVVSGVISHISQLPGKVFTEFTNIGSKMLQAGSRLYEQAKEVGRKIVENFLNAMQINSPGKIQRATVQEFVDTIGRIRDQIKPAGDAAYRVGKAIVDNFGNEKIAKTLDVVTNINENETLNPLGDLVQDLNASTVTLEINHTCDEIVLTHDFLNLPEGVDAEEVAKLVRETTNDEAWIKNLVSSDVFQSFDNKIKTMLERKMNRAKGV